MTGAHKLYVVEKAVYKRPDNVGYARRRSLETIFFVMRQTEQGLHGCNQYREVRI